MDSWWRGMERSTLNVAKGMMTHGRLALSAPEGPFSGVWLKKGSEFGRRWS